MRKFAILLVALLLVTGAAEAATTAGPGLFRRGGVRFGLFGGLGNTLGQSYGILGGGVGYFLTTGLEAGLDYEAWFGNSPTFQKITPQLRYVFWQKTIKPYVGAFWRRTIMSSDWPNYDSWGGRAGLAYQQGRSYVAIGVVHEIFLDNDDIRFVNDSQTYPEIAFWFSF